MRICGTITDCGNSDERRNTKYTQRRNNAISATTQTTEVTAAKIEAARFRTRPIRQRESEGTTT